MPYWPLEQDPSLGPTLLPVSLQVLTLTYATAPVLLHCGQERALRPEIQMHLAAQTQVPPGWSGILHLVDSLLNRVLGVLSVVCMLAESCQRHESEVLCWLWVHTFGTVGV